MLLGAHMLEVHDLDLLLTSEWCSCRYNSSMVLPSFGPWLTLLWSNTHLPKLHPVCEELKSTVLAPWLVSFPMAASFIWGSRASSFIALAVKWQCCRQFGLASCQWSHEPKHLSQRVICLLYLFFSRHAWAWGTKLAKGPLKVRSDFSEQQAIPSKYCQYHQRFQSQAHDLYRQKCNAWQSQLVGTDILIDSSNAGVRCCDDSCWFHKQRFVALLSLVLCATGRNR